MESAQELRNTRELKKMTDGIARATEIKKPTTSPIIEEPEESHEIPLEGRESPRPGLATRVFNEDFD